MSKHTPGPWSVPHFAKPEVNCECGYVLCNEHMGAICTVHCSDNNSVEAGDNPLFEAACANARLISAAPDLLAACEESFECLRIMGVENGGLGSRLSAAIAKARGEE